MPEISKGHDRQKQRVSSRIKRGVSRLGYAALALQKERRKRLRWLAAHIAESPHDSPGEIPNFVAPQPPIGFDNLTVEEDAERFLHMCHAIEAREDNNSHMAATASTPPSLPSVFPNGPLNLNPDGSTINFKKSHAGPNAAHWIRADGEEMQRLFDTDTIRPIRFKDIPQGKVVTCVNPVCVEKLKDDGSIKFRMRLTIGGDRIVYPFDKSAVSHSGYGCP